MKLNGVEFRREGHPPYKRMKDGMHMHGNSCNNLHTS